MDQIDNSRRISDLDLIASAPSAAALWRRFEEVTRKLGFVYYVYVFARRDGSYFHKTNLPRRFYAGPECDPFLTYCCNNLGHTFTGADFLPSYEYLGESERRFIEQAKGSGMRTGIGIPVRTRSQPEYGGFNLGTRLSRELFEAGPGKLVDKVRALCLLAQQRIDELGIVSEAPDEPGALALGSLTRRERQIYELLASGVSRSDIAERASISAHTVDTHIKSVYRKLGVNSQREAMQVASPDLA